LPKSGRFEQKTQTITESQLRVTGANLAVIGTFYPPCQALSLLSREHTDQTHHDRGFRYSHYGTTQAINPGYATTTWVHYRHHSSAAQSVANL